MLLVVPGRCFCGGSFCFVSLCLKYIFVLLAPCVCLRVFGWVRVTGWPPVGGWLLVRLAKCFHGISA